MTDLKIYYSSLSDPHFINCNCNDWRVDNYSVIVETILNKTDLNTLRTHLTPGAVGEFYKILGRTIYNDRTWKGDNTIMLSPDTNSQSNLKGMRSNTLIFVKNLSDEPIEGDKGWLKVKIEGYISGSSNL